MYYIWRRRVWLLDWNLSGRAPRYRSSHPSDDIEDHLDGKLPFSGPPRLKITIFGTTSTENIHFHNHLNGKYTFSQPPRRKIAIFTTTSTENIYFHNHLDRNYHFHNHLDRKLLFSEPPRRKISIFKITSTENYHFQICCDLCTKRICRTYWYETKIETLIHSIYACM